MRAANPSERADRDAWAVLNTLARAPAVRGLREVVWSTRREAPLAGPPLYFLHIMKTGGTSLTEGLRGLLGARASLTDVFLDDLVCVPAYVLEGVPLVAGHFGREARDLLPADFVACTVLREPVERTLSHYWHLRSDPGVVEESPSFCLDEFVHSPRWRTLCENYQARQLVHRVGIRDAWVTWSPHDRFRALGPPYPPEHQLPLQSLFDCAPMGVAGDELLGRALEALATIEHVGVTERLDDLFARLAASWGVDAAPPLPRSQVRAGRPRLDDVPPTLVDDIREATTVDRALYDAARRGRAGGPASRP